MTAAVLDKEDPAIAVMEVLPCCLAKPLLDLRPGFHIFGFESLVVKGLRVEGEPWRSGFMEVLPLSCHESAPLNPQSKKRNPSQNFQPLNPETHP